MKSKWFRIFLLSLIAVLAADFALLWQSRSFSFSRRSDALRFYISSDSLLGGNSQISRAEFDSTGMHLSFVPQSGIEYPYAGMSIAPKKGFLKLRRYSTLTFQIDSLSNHHFMLLMRSEPKRLDRETLPTKSVLLVYHLNEKSGRVNIPLRKFRIPQWWMIDYGKKVNADRNRITALGFTNGDHGNLGETRTIELSDISFERNMWAIGGIYLGIILAALLGGVMVQRIIRVITLRKIYYKPLEIIEFPQVNSSKRILDAIEKLYTTDLSQKDLAHICGVSTNYITHIIHQEKGVGFRDYINIKRIEDAERLLKESGASITEIALEVGYNYPGTFNRVFKRKNGISPTEFRREQLTS